MGKSRDYELEVEGRRTKLSDLDKVSRRPLHERAGYRLLRARFRLPAAHLKDRPVTLKRYLDGIHGDFFYEKDAPAFTPDWVSKFQVPRHAGGSDICYP